jgi:hypothetical protein
MPSQSTFCCKQTQNLAIHTCTLSQRPFCGLHLTIIMSPLPILSLPFTLGIPLASHPDGHLPPTQPCAHLRDMDDCRGNAVPHELIRAVGTHQLQEGGVMKILHSSIDALFQPRVHQGPSCWEVVCGKLQAGGNGVTGHTLPAGTTTRCQTCYNTRITSDKTHESMSTLYAEADYSLPRSSPWSRAQTKSAR